MRQELLVGKRQMALLAAMASIGLISNSALAVDSSFQNHLQSPTMVSPAQLYQIQSIKSDFQLTYSSAEQTAKPENADKEKFSKKGTGIFAAGVYNFNSVGMRAGLTVDYGKDDFSNDDQADLKMDDNEFVVTPQVAYPVGPVVLGAGLAISQREMDIQEETYKSQHNRGLLGVLFADSGIEAGVTYRAATKQDSNEEKKELAVYEPATVIAHGRYAIDQSMAVGGMIENYHFKGLNKDLYKDRVAVRGTFEYLQSAMKFEGDVAWRSAAYKNKESLASLASVGTENDWISTVALTGAADYAMNEDTSVGGVLGYEFGSDSVNGTKYEADQLTIGVRGNIRM